MYARSWFIIVSSIALSSCGGSDAAEQPDASSPVGDASASPDGFEQPDAASTSNLTLQFVDPDHGPFTGGTEVLVRGTGFEPSTIVRFGGRAVEPLAFEYVDSRRIIVRTPPGEPGITDVEVQNGADTASLNATYTYEALDVDPPLGSVAGGTFVTISGLGTNFGPDTIVTFDGLEMTDVRILGDQVLTGYTPPGTAGTADVVTITTAGVFEAERAFIYESTGDPFFGGMSGGSVSGTVNVVVVDANTKDGVPDAFVALGDPNASAFQGRTDFLGQITFSDPSITAPIRVTAAAEGYETSMFVDYDAANITIFLRKPPEPFNGPPPPAAQTGHIYGHVLFGDATQLGSPHWDIVPEPRTPTERKRLYVTTTSRNMFSRPYGPTRFIDYEYNENIVAWEFDAWTRPAATALVAIAGLYDPERDPSGTGSTGFEPFAMGVTRGVLVGPGETVLGVDIVVNIPLDAALNIQLDEPTALDSPGWEGPSYHKVRPFIDLGGEGVILMNKNGMLTPPSPEQRPNHYRFESGADAILLGGMSPLIGAVSDASYGFIIGSYSEVDTNPFSVRVVRGFSDISEPIVIDEFIGTPRALDPGPETLGSDMALSYENEAPAQGKATFHLHLLTSTEGDQLARVFTRGNVWQVPLPNLEFAGLPTIPKDQDVSWTMWSIRLNGTTFDQFTYRQLSSLYWEAYAADSSWVQFPGFE